MQMPLGQHVAEALLPVLLEGASVMGEDTGKHTRQLGYYYTI